MIENAMIEGMMGTEMRDSTRFAIVWFGMIAAIIGDEIIYLVVSWLLRSYPHTVKPGPLLGPCQLTYLWLTLRMKPKKG